MSLLLARVANSLPMLRRFRLWQVLLLPVALAAFQVALDWWCNRPVHVWVCHRCGCIGEERNRSIYGWTLAGTSMRMKRSEFTRYYEDVLGKKCDKHFFLPALPIADERVHFDFLLRESRLSSLPLGTHLRCENYLVQSWTRARTRLFQSLAAHDSESAGELLRYLRYPLVLDNSGTPGNPVHDLTDWLSCLGRIEAREWKGIDGGSSPTLEEVLPAGWTIIRLHSRASRCFGHE